MEARAVARYQRISPRKVRQVIDLIRGKSYDEAVAILKFTPKAASPLVQKVLRSAAANAENNHNLDPHRMYVARAFADPGPVMKRVMPRARGMAYLIRKRTSHVTVVLRTREE
ncbi:50S ribosomal protein L22 [Carboxydochorda subterranea]|uniref:Large ribosomal subunit protein uL22 n=1 Tax=Carboxydichorda subterranea TaxID=3109565 RepID=A0ABZ1BYD9_9FIRM|nr:50S ribosomal protein L22 [Limnochorda sp. L945t]WRP17721.1 50S ribosomal protein L22 [Limnochorda sp. L945t]